MLPCQIAQDLDGQQNSTFPIAYTAHEETVEILVQYILHLQDHCIAWMRMSREMGRAVHGGVFWDASPGSWGPQ